MPKNLDMAGAAPLLCAGITTYSPLRYYGLDKPGMKLGVVGLGGLGEPTFLVPAFPSTLQVRFSGHAAADSRTGFSAVDRHAAYVRHDLNSGQGNQQNI